MTAYYATVASVSPKLVVQYLGTSIPVVNGIGVLLGLERVTVPGATGYVETNYRGKGEAALAALGRHDAVFVHVEGPDEAGHQGKAAEKVRALERIDAELLGPLLAGLARLGPHRVLVVPDHYTPIARRTHVGAPVPYLLWPAPAGVASGALRLTEAEAASTGIEVDPGHRLLDRLLG